ncbi:MAG: hypothetical protein Kow0069_37420 [Promethearchaeota archaeon]
MSPIKKDELAVEFRGLVEVCRQPGRVDVYEGTEFLERGIASLVRAMQDLSLSHLVLRGTREDNYFYEKYASGGLSGDVDVTLTPDEERSPWNGQV